MGAGSVSSRQPGRRDALTVTVGVAALVAPALHSLTDVLEWRQQGFSAVQLWLNYLAFLPMPWLLLGIYAVRDTGRGGAALIGALLYGFAFTYFAHTTLYALAEGIPDYAALWTRLGGTYTVHGGLMVLGGLLFSLGSLRSGWLPRGPVLLFLAGIVTNLVLALLPGPDILQTVGSALRNVGLMGMGYVILFDGRPDR
jgi:hypothetical protein